MCGIVGILRAAAVPPEAESALLRQMTDTVRHRGPNDEGIWLGEGVGFGHRRLSIIDTSNAGHQPMTRGACALVLNGEIYNYRELRIELEAKGEIFVSNSDTEVLLVLLMRDGRRALERINGMFAFAFWDGASRELMLARDRIGKKPLYYARIAHTLVFGSEIKAILKYPGFERRPNLEAIHHYLSLQYVPSPLTAFEGVKCLPPGSIMVCRPGNTAEPERYWSLPSPATIAVTRSQADLAAELRHLIEASVKRRMVADVPVGAFLSGGVDSSTVTALMALEAGANVKTFCIGFGEEAYDERRYARMVAERYATDHHEEVVTEDAADIIPELIWHYGQPFGDPSAIPTFYLSRLARRSVTVALSGDGSDELFLGYERYATCRRYGWADRIPRLARSAVGLAASSIVRPMSDWKYVRTGKRIMQLASSSRASRYEPTIAYFSGEDKADAYGPQLRDQLGTRTMDLLEPYLDAAPTLVEGAAWADLHSYLPDDILVKVDVASMAFGLEARAPFLDVDVMEWAARLPGTQKAADGQLKSLLKLAVADLLPPEILTRPKMGFGAPLDLWLRGGFAKFARDVLTSKTARARALFRPEAVKRLLDEHISGRRLHHTRLWAMLMLELWFAMWIDGDGQRPRHS